MNRRNFLALLPVAAVLPGCATSGKIDWVAIAVNAARNGAQIGTAYGIQKGVSSEVFHAVSAALSNLIKDRNFDAAAIASVLQRLPLQGAGQFGGLIISNIVTIYDVATSTYIDLASSPVAEKIVTAIRDGIDAGITSVTKALVTIPTLKPGQRIVL